MRVVSLQVKDFKCFADQTFEFSNDTRIEAENYQGKTSIAEAIMFALFGTNVTGSAVGIDDYIRTGAKTMEVALIVEIGAEQHEVVRTKGKTSAVFLDGHKSDNNAVAGLVGDKAEFLSVFTPGYFASLSNGDARSMVMGLVKMPEKGEVLDRLSSAEAGILAYEPLRDPDGWAKQLRDDIKAEQKEQERARGQIELLESRVNAEIEPIEEWDGAELADLLAKRSNQQSVAADQTIKLREEVVALRHKYSAQQAKIKQIPSAPLVAGDPCPFCQVPLTQEALDTTLTSHVDEVRRIELANSACRTAMEQIAAQAQVLKQQLNALTETPTVERDHALDDRIAELETRQSLAQQHNARVEQMLLQRTKDEAALSEVRRKLADYEREDSRLQSIVRALGLYRAKLAEMQVEQLKQHLNKVSIQLFDVVKSTGEIKATFDLLYEGREYRTLSYSERIRANLEIATLINQARGEDWPVFLDNAESITHYTRPAATQVIEAHVVAGAQLTVHKKEADAA